MGQRFGESALLPALLAAGLFVLALPTSAQMGPGMTGTSHCMRGSCARQMSELQRDLASQMQDMSGKMSMGTVSAALQKQMGDRMRAMADMMDSMSGMMGQGRVMNADSQKRMEGMRVQMKALMHGGK